MADGSGSSGVLGVLVGALIVIIVGGAILYGTGVVGNHHTASVNISVPKVGTTGSK